MATNKSFNGSQNEQGFSSFFHLLFILSVAFIFHKFWDGYLDSQKFEMQIIYFGVFGVFVAYSLISLTYSIFSGEKSKGEMRKIIRKESKKLSNILNEYSSEVSNIRTQLKKLTGVMKPEGFRELAIVESLLASLEGRLQKVQVHSKSSDADEVHYAYTSLLEDLTNADDTMQSITLCDVIEPISLNKLKTNLDARIAKVKHLVPATRGNSRYAH